MLELFVHLAADSGLTDELVILNQELDLIIVIRGVKAIWTDTLPTVGVSIHSGSHGAPLDLDVAGTATVARRG